MTLQPEDLADTALEALLALEGTRKMVALAGPPAAGKSTVSALLRDRLVGRDSSAEVLPMDGFHLDNSLLSARGLLDRKGAPDSFDAAGFVHLMRRAASGEPLVFPIFDRERDIAIAGAGYLPAETEFVLVEGNYLLLDAAPWSDLRALWDLAIWIDAAPSQLEDRLTERWLTAGLPEAEARARVERNDLPNAELIRRTGGFADLRLSSDA
ncbi:hypothetical protein SAMN05444007_109156 [Cribrihabitans marinus]|uniref:Fructokinase n=1 Tax=Cribrihabitans marinus TaxID=1227549 RepID=A0A1H7D3I6_9RHOB|nr:hypothetical protein [Cribrihabitans marinus]GGH37538.1 nucleoside triphosphate hydrolase [Cribrihabitans marinus]SEJ95904.1 hypothetical protein SAMN05444007_109156 [Cribrihabitans marinus]